MVDHKNEEGDFSVFESAAMLFVFSLRYLSQNWTHQIGSLYIAEVCYLFP